MNSYATLIVVVLIGGLVAVFLFINKKLSDLADNHESSEEQVENIVNQVFGKVVNKVTTQAKNVLQSDKDAIFKDNQNKKEIIEKLVKDLKREIGDRQEEIRELEKDRNKKFGEITTSIDEHRKITEELKVSTEALSRVLSNNQARGAWGERIIEDILNNAGLIKNIHYEKQKALGKSAVIPDITLLLPNNRKVAIDAKFPYSEVQKMASARTKTEKAQHLKAFSNDIKAKVNQITDRGYIDIEHGTLDYAIMFVPNEMVFSFINQQFPDVVDEAMSKKIMIVSPFTFLIVARTVMESYKNFMMENNLRRIIKHISEFTDEWSKFANEFGKFQTLISKIQNQYDKILTTRYKKMSVKIRKIEEDQRVAKLPKDTAKR